MKCLHCRSDKVSKMGFTKQGKQRYVCQNQGYERSFILEYSNYGCHPGNKEKIVDMALNGSGIRDTARVLEISQGTVIDTLKKEPLLSNVNERFLQQLNNPEEIAVKLEKVQEAEADEMWSSSGKRPSNVGFGTPLIMPAEPRSPMYWARMRIVH